MAGDTDGTATEISKDEIETIAKEAVDNLVADLGAEAVFPFDKIWDYTTRADEVPSLRRPGAHRRLKRDGYIEDTGRRTRASSSKRAGSPTTEYRPGRQYADKLGGKPSGTILELSKQLLVDESWLAETLSLLEEKKQLVLQGPPGTGKTFIARALAQHLTGSETRISLVQFHPSYAYEDFVSGYRPTLIDGQPGFQLKPGPLLRLAELADTEPDETFVLIIDEMNRGNLASVFGELYFLLEYRDEAVELLYGLGSEDTPEDEQPRFALPPNLMIIGTMNTADRSIALVDSALRRRFYFVDLFPDIEPIKGLLSRWLDANNRADLLWLSDLIERANERLGDRHAAIGPSYYLSKDPQALDEQEAERVWKHAVMPYLAERFYERPEDLAQFVFAGLRSSVQDNGANEQSDAAADAPAS